MKNKKSELYEAKEYSNVKEIMQDTFKKYPNNIAFKIKEINEEKKSNVEYKNITYKDFENDIINFGTKLIDMGLKNKRIAIISKNRYEWIVSYLAVICGTGIAVPLDKGLPKEEIESLLTRSKADAVIFSEDYTEIMNDIIKNNICDVKEFICMDKYSNFKYMYDLIEDGKKICQSGNREYIDAKINNDEMDILLFTSGTTSISKAVMLTHRNIASNITALNKAEKIYENDVNMAFLPLHHTFGSTGILFFLSNGCMNVFCDGIRHIQNNLKEYKVSVFVCVPLLLEAMYKKIEDKIEKTRQSKKVELAKKISKFLLKFKIDIRRKIFKEIIENLGGNLRFIVSGASAIDKKVAEGFNDFGILTVQGYGLTETSPVLTAENIENIKYGSIGLPLSGIELKLENKDENEIGEIVATGPNLMIGYYENNEATNEVIKVDTNGKRWFYTGDLGKIDKDGYIYITGRKKNVIVLKNGKNIFPEELEILINNLPYVEESMVFGFPKDEDLVVSVKIVYNKDYIKEHFRDINNEELYNKIWEDIKEINKGLTNYKHMKKLIITDEPMIKTSTAKIKRYEEISKIIKENK